MQKKTKYLVSFLFVALAASILIFYRLSEMSKWSYVGEAESPNSKFVASIYDNMLDGSDEIAPYGYYIFVNPKYRISSAINSSPVFIGYCKNQISIIWQSENELQINCITEKPEDIHLLSSQVNGINIKVMQN